MFISLMMLAIAQLVYLSNAAALGVDLEKRQSQTGRATFYGGNVQGGTCSFSTYTLPSGISGAALSGASWNNAGNCGGCATVTGPNGKKITAMIVDKCPECPANGLDLFQDAFGQLAELKTGVINVNWEYTPCPITSNLQIHLKSGVSRYYFSAQVVNAKRRTDKMEVSTDGGKTYKAAARQDYNFFEIRGDLGTDRVNIRVTSRVGTQVVIPNVQLSSDASVTASGNYA